MQRLIKRDLRNSHVTEGELAHYLHVPRTTVSARLGVPVTSMFYEKCEHGIGAILHWRAKRYDRKHV